MYKLHVIFANTSTNSNKDNLTADFNPVNSYAHAMEIVANLLAIGLSLNAFLRPADDINRGYNGPYAIFNGKEWKKIINFE